MNEGTRFSFTAPFDVYADLQRLDRIASAIGASPDIATSYEEAACEFVGKLRGAVTQGADPIGRWIAADDVNRLVREIDVALNGGDAAPQAKLCDIAAQVGKAAREFGPILQVLGLRTNKRKTALFVDDTLRERLIDVAWNEYVRDGAGAGFVSAADMRRIINAVVATITSQKEGA